MLGCLRTTIRGAWSLWRCCRPLVLVRGFGLFLHRIIIVPVVHLTTLLRSGDILPVSLNDASNWRGRSTHARLRWRSGYQARKRRSSRHRRRKQQSTSSVYHTPSGLSAHRRRAEDDKDGHLIYHDGDILHSRCTQSFVYLLILGDDLAIVVSDIQETQLLLQLHSFYCINVICMLIINLVLLTVLWFVIYTISK